MSKRPIAKLTPSCQDDLDYMVEGNGLGAVIRALEEICEAKAAKAVMETGDGIGTECWYWKRKAKGLMRYRVQLALE